MVLGHRRRLPSQVPTQASQYVCFQGLVQKAEGLGMIPSMR
jgi:hypothetical protein